MEETVDSNESNSLAANADAKPTRRIPLWVLWLVVGLMFVLTLLLSVWLPWQRRLQMIEEIESLGGAYSVQTAGPDWIRDLLGHPYHGFFGNSKFGPFDEIIEVDFSQTKGRNNSMLSADLISRLSVFSTLRELDLSYTSVTDDWMPQIAELKSLQNLNLPHCKISGRGFGALKALPHLETINLAYCPLSDEGLQRLGKIPTLKTIGVIRCSRLTTEGIEQFEKARPDCNLYGAR